MTRFTCLYHQHLLSYCCYDRSKIASILQTKVPLWKHWSSKYKGKDVSWSQYEFAAELCCCRENIKCVDGLLSSVHTADTTAVQRVMSRLRLLSAAVSSSRKEAHSGSTGCWFHLRNHLSGWPCLTEPETDCVWSCRLAQRGQTVLYWCSRITEIRNNCAAWGLKYIQPTGEKVYCVALQSSPDTESSHNVQSMIHASHTGSIKKHCHPDSSIPYLSFPHTHSSAHFVPLKALPPHVLLQKYHKQI